MDKTLYVDGTKLEAGGVCYVERAAGRFRMVGVHREA